MPHRSAFPFQGLYPRTESWCLPVPAWPPEHTEPCSCKALVLSLMLSLGRVINTCNAHFRTAQNCTICVGFGVDLLRFLLRAICSALYAIAHLLGVQICLFGSSNCLPQTIVCRNLKVQLTAAHAAGLCETCKSIRVSTGATYTWQGLLGYWHWHRPQADLAAMVRT